MTACSMDATGGDAGAFEHVAATLRAIKRGDGLAFACAVGALVLEQFFEGRTELWRSRKRSKNYSIRRLAQHPDCPLSRSALNSCVAVCVALRELSDRTDPLDGAQAFPQITASHVAVVARLPAAERSQWLQRSGRQSWTVRELRQRLADPVVQDQDIEADEDAIRLRRAARRLASAVEMLEQAVAAYTNLPLNPATLDLVECLAARLNGAVGSLKPVPLRMQSERRLKNALGSLELEDG